jgi:uncharacterized protein
MTRMSSEPFRRKQFETALNRAREPRRFIQVLTGPRQVGKTTLARQVVDAQEAPAHYASADDPGLRDPSWLEAQWDIGRRLARDGEDRGGLLVLDEVQKISGWSETVKRLWDEDSATGIGARVFLLGSAPLLVGRGLTESLAGRFELIRVSHWSFPEMREAFGFDIEQYMFFGGYPGAAGLVGDEDRWRRYILDSLVETTLSRDVLLLTRVDKPALLRQLFQLACDHSSEILSFQKMLGQLHDAGNTTTLSHYLDLLGQAEMVVGLQKFSGSVARQRGSSPKLVALNSALVTASAGRSLSETRADPARWGRIVETAIGAHLVNGALDARAEVLYWRDRGKEVDFVLRAGDRVISIEVTGGPRKRSLPGLAAFESAYPGSRPLLVGGQGIALEKFLEAPITRWLDEETAPQGERAKTWTGRRPG